MAQELQKPQQQAGQLATWQHLYKAAWEQGFNEFMFLMAEQYSLELLVEVEINGRREMLPSPMVQFWRENLTHLSPRQMREGLKNYMASERRSFKPTPEDIRENATAIKGTDKPRKVKNPDCQDCRGSGYRMIEVDSAIHLGKKANRVTDCYCVRVEYGGNTYMDAAKQLPAAEFSSHEVIKKLSEHIPVSKNAAKAMPSTRQPSDEELARRRQEMLNDLARKVKA